MRLFRSSMLVLTAAALAGPASATDIDFAATLTNACTLSTPTDGALALSTDGTVLSSELTAGGTPATVSVLSIGNSTLNFTAPSMASAPAAYDDTSETVELKYQGAGGLSAVSQSYTTGPTSVNVSTIPLSVLTLDAKVTNTDSFVDGDYTVRTVMTCS